MVPPLLSNVQGKYNYKICKVENQECKFEYTYTKTSIDKHCY